jgi:hypothetical protein
MVWRLHGVLKRNTWGSIDNNFFWHPHVGYVVAKVKAATKTLYPLLCCKNKLPLRNGNYICDTTSHNGIRVCCLDLRHHCDSVGTSSAPELIAACSEKGAVSCAKWCSSPGSSAEPYRHSFPTLCRGPLQQVPGTLITCWWANLFTSHGRGHVIADHLTFFSASFYLLM